MSPVHIAKARRLFHICDMDWNALNTIFQLNVKKKYKEKEKAESKAKNKYIEL